MNLNSATSAAAPATPKALSREQPLFIVMNAGSGHKDAQQARQTIEEVLAGAGQRHVFLLAEEPKDISAVARVAVQRASRENGAVVAAGGDGTINAVAQAVLGTGLPFGVLPQGTFNYFGRANGISQDTAESARALLGAEPRPVQIGLINERVFLVNASLGWYPRLLENREAYKQRFGRSRLVAFWAALVSLIQPYRALSLRIESEVGEHLLRTPTLFVGNNVLQLRQIGVEEAEWVARGHLAAITVAPVGLPTRFRLLLSGLAGRLGRAEPVLSFAFRTLTVQPAHWRGGASVKVAMDGEVTRMAMPLVFRLAPQPLLLLAPPGARDDPPAVARA